MIKLERERDAAIELLRRWQDWGVRVVTGHDVSDDGIMADTDAILASTDTS